MHMNHFQISLIALVIFSYSNLGLIAQEDKEHPPHYVFPTFIKGSVIMKNGNTNHSLLNYNTVTQEMIFEQNGKRLALDKLKTIDTVIISDRKFIPVGNVFYEVAHMAPISLYIQHKGEITNEGRPIGYGTTRQTTSSTSFSKLTTEDGLYDLKLPDAYYVTNTSINWIKMDGSMVKFVNRRQFLKIFPDQENELKQFIKEHKIDLKVREDLITLVKYCNEVMQ